MSAGMSAPVSTIATLDDARARLRTVFGYDDFRPGQAEVVVVHRAMAEAVGLARRNGVGAVTIRRMSHMGAAGAYALWAAEPGGDILCEVRVYANAALYDAGESVSAVIARPG